MLSFVSHVACIIIGDIMEAVTSDTVPGGVLRLILPVIAVLIASLPFSLLF